MKRESLQLQFKALRSFLRARFVLVICVDIAANFTYWAIWHFAHGRQLVLSISSLRRDQDPLLLRYPPRHRSIRRLSHLLLRLLFILLDFLNSLAARCYNHLPFLFLCFFLFLVVFLFLQNSSTLLR